MGFTRRTKVRHISPAELFRIAEILSQPSTNPAWKKLMQIVPHELTDDEQLNDSRPKYNPQHIRSIETAGVRIHNAAQLFLEEWSTSGGIAPSLGHLLQLLVKCELFRAADYVAVNLLNEAPPQRPQQGPAARIDIPFPDEDNDIEGGLSTGNYPNRSDVMDVNICHGAEGKAIASKQIFDHSLLPDRPIMNETLAGNVNGQREALAGNVPHFSNFTNPSQSAQFSDANIPNLSILNIANENDLIATEQGDSSVGNLPLMSQLLQSSEELHSNERQGSFGGHVPHLSQLLGEWQSTFNERMQTNFNDALDGNVPQFSQLLGQSQPTSANSVSELNANNEPNQHNSIDGNVPHLSQLMYQPQSTSGISASGLNSDESVDENVPHLSQLMNGT